MERRHKDKQEELRSQLADGHKVHMDKMREELSKLYEEEKEKVTGPFHLSYVLPFMI